MKHLKNFNEGYNDHDDQICVPIGVTKSQLLSIVKEKFPNAQINIELIISDFAEWMSVAIEESDVDVMSELNKFIIESEASNAYHHRDTLTPVIESKKTFDDTLDDVDKQHKKSIAKKYTEPQNDIDDAFELLDEFLKEKGYNWKKLEKKYIVYAKTSFNEMGSPAAVGKKIIKEENK